jgi:hypothetical protein
MTRKTPDARLITWFDRLARAQATAQTMRLQLSDTQQIDSPDQRYAMLLTSNEMRMSHSVLNAALWERTPERLLLAIGDWQWSSEQITWSADSQWVTIALRRYPGDAPGIVVDIYPERQIVIPHAPAATQPLPFAALNTFLERYYAQHRQARS